MTDKYDRLLHTWAKEREIKRLQDLSDHFLMEMKDYITAIDIVEEESNNIQVRISQQEIDRAKMMLKNLVNLRLKKIITAEIKGIPISALSWIVMAAGFMWMLYMLTTGISTSMKEIALDVISSELILN